VNNPADEASAAAVIRTLPPKAAMTAAVEILLSDPEPCKMTCSNQLPVSCASAWASRDLALQG
jgi:hypothetical protein